MADRINLDMIICIKRLRHNRLDVKDLFFFISVKLCISKNANVPYLPLLIILLKLFLSSLIPLRQTLKQVFNLINIPKRP